MTTDAPRFSVLFLALCVTAATLASAVAQDETERKLRPMIAHRGDRTVETVHGRSVVLSGTAQLTVTADDPIGDGAVRFNSPDAWLYLPALRPSEVRDRYLDRFTVGEAPAELGVNLRIAPVVAGAVVIPQGPDYPGLSTYTLPRLRGRELQHTPHTYYRAQELGEHHDAIQSFVLRKGYMATLAVNEDGTGPSQVFIARDQDLRVSRLPAELAGQVSFVRVFPWKWTAKKGFGGGAAATTKLNGYWRYDWGAGGKSTLDVEYVPMRHNRHWDSFKKINEKEGSLHLLGFNEPMQKDQANMTMEQCLALWPKLQASGLRLGSPCPTDGTVNWVYRFMDEADRRGLRVDFVCIHFYRGNFTAPQLIAWLRKIHERTGKPIWLTEYNNGAPWVKNHKPSKQENARRLAEFAQALDRCDFVERYAVFNIGGNRRVIENGQLTPAGRLYARNRSAEAYTGD